MVQAETHTSESVKNNRKHIIKLARSMTRIRAGDKRVVGIRLCGICHRKLSTYSVELQRMVVSTDHFSCKVSDIVTINICADIRSCYANVNKKEGEK